MPVTFTAPAKGAGPHSCALYGPSEIVPWAPPRVKAGGLYACRVHERTSPLAGWRAAGPCAAGCACERGPRLLCQPTGRLPARRLPCSRSCCRPDSPGPVAAGSPHAGGMAEVRLLKLRSSALRLPPRPAAHEAGSVPARRADQHDCPPELLGGGARRPQAGRSRAWVRAALPAGRSTPESVLLLRSRERSLVKPAAQAPGRVPCRKLPDRSSAVSWAAKELRLAHPASSVPACTARRPGSPPRRSVRGAGARPTSQSWPG